MLREMVRERQIDRNKWTNTSRRIGKPLSTTTDNKNGTSSTVGFMPFRDARISNICSSHHLVTVSSDDSARRTLIKSTWIRKGTPVPRIVVNLLDCAIRFDTQSSRKTAYV